MFLEFVRDARTASAWIDANREHLNSAVRKPWVVTTSYDEVAAFVDRQLAQGCSYEDIRDETVFDFDDSKDIALFLREMRSSSPPIKVNVSLFGAQYLKTHASFY